MLLGFLFLELRIEPQNFVLFCFVFVLFCLYPNNYSTTELYPSPQTSRAWPCMASWYLHLSLPLPPQWWIIPVTCAPVCKARQILKTGSQARQNALSHFTSEQFKLFFFGRMYHQRYFMSLANSSSSPTLKHRRHLKQQFYRDSYICIGSFWPWFLQNGSSGHQHWNLNHSIDYCDNSSKNLASHTWCVWSAHCQ